MEDAPALLRCYGDQAAVPFFNADNCNGATFYCATEADVAEAVHIWLLCYARREFVRFAIEDGGHVVGTAEMFHCDADDRPQPYGVLRVDVASPHERADFLTDVFALCESELFAAFDVREMVTKAVPAAAERRKALASLGCEATCFRTYPDYFSLKPKG